MRRHYVNEAPATMLTGSVDSSVTTVNVASMVGFPTTVPFTVEVDVDTASAEIMLVTAVVGTALTVTRGYDSTAAQGHTAGAGVRHVAVAADFDEANQHVNDVGNVHGVTSQLVGASDAQTITNKTFLQNQFRTNGAVIPLDSVAIQGSHTVLRVQTGGTTTASLNGNGLLTVANITSAGNIVISSGGLLVAGQTTMVGTATVSNSLTVAGAFTAANITTAGTVTTGNLTVTGSGSVDLGTGYRLVKSGLKADRPAAGTVTGQLYSQTDNGRVMTWTGTRWEPLQLKQRQHMDGDLGETFFSVGPGGDNNVNSTFIPNFTNTDLAFVKFKLNGYATTAGVTGLPPGPIWAGYVRLIINGQEVGESYRFHNRGVTNMCPWSVEAEIYAPAQVNTIGFRLSNDIGSNVGFRNYVTLYSVDERA